MTTEPNTAAQAPIPLRTKVQRSFWMITSTVATAAVIIWLVFPPARSRSQSSKSIEPGTAAQAVPPVRVVGRGALTISADTPLLEHLVIVKIATSTVRFPKLSVTGSVLARVRDQKGSFEDRWQFATHELSTTYADWVRAKAEVEFASSQLAKTKQLTKAETDHLEAVVKRLQPLNADALVPTAQFKQAEADLLKSQLQGEKDVFTAELNLRTAQKDKAALERDLSQAGVEAGVFASAVDNMVLVVANVPENRISEVHLKDGCEARFYGYPEKSFPGHVESFSTTITPDRRMLRVLFELNDPADQLRPGMYGEVGLGTDARESYLIPPESLLHIGRDDYVLARATPSDPWKVTKVTLGELHDGKFEILSGLEAGGELIADGAVLLKPPAVEALTAVETGRP